ncbi:unnamed protein product [Periconia digitata]|uniref:FAD-binding PCMH-type domain-containing protein n=1 Tax=Periconia digitata TaxID=1303443 RepID=A0A9W4XFW7_9PLEO|nr:unnamed protein product [Periconia digitata]
MLQYLAKAGAVASLLWMTSASPQNSGNASVPCEALLSTNLSSRVLLPNDPLYEPRVQSYYIGNGRLHPWCFFLPQTASELSTAIKALSAAATAAGEDRDWHIAVRSGGHMWPGSNNIINGVTIDMGNMNASSYDEQTKLASIETGARWSDVYRILHDRYNVTVTGGRDGDVGVGGFLLGGGNSYHTGRNGFGCDTIINYQVILANGSIVDANQSENPDLYKALKGGGPNYGIVTRFDVETLPAVDLAFGDNIYDVEHMSEMMDAQSDFTATTDESGGDHTFNYFQIGANDSLVFARKVNTKGNLNTSAFDAFNRIPTKKQDWSLTSLADAAPPAKEGEGLNAASYTYTAKNTRPMAQYILSRFQRLSTTLSTKYGAEKYMTLMITQPLPAYYSTISQRNGGNVLGLDKQLANTSTGAALYVIAITPLASTDEALAVADAEIKAMLEDLDREAEKQDAVVQWRYMNYADASQNPLASYGEENLEFLEKVAGVYDPEGWWQDMVPGGFKIGKARV